ncbi:hypothetical protein BC628DRAFT_1309421 [Trametes gibbosa]|nr:hypothetical protein BC628DRAFT_1309421 [Trametes gibbosa]
MPSGPPPPPPFFPEDSQNTFAAEFLHHPDFRATAGFLLGWVFWCSISYAYESQFFQLLGYTCWTFLRRKPAQSPASDVEARAAADPEKYARGREASVQGMSHEAALVFTLNLCFAFASFAEFCSILAYDPGGADTACAFTVAWANMAAQAARLIGLSILVLQLKQRVGWSVEFYSLSIALVVALSFILAFNATNTGDIVLIRTLGVSICVKTQYLPTALLTSIGFILLEVYMAIRFLGWEDRQYGWRPMLKRSANLQVTQGLSLLIIDILTLAPNVANTNVLAQFVPFSLGALIVLIAFNYRIHDGSAPDPEVASFRPSRSPTPLPLSQFENHTPSIAARASHIEPQDGGVIVIDSPSELRSPEVAMNPEDQPHVIPSSAPPCMGGVSVFADLQARQILPFQAQYAEHLERHIHRGPIVPTRPQRQRPNVQVIIEDMQTVRNSTVGSDIVRLPSAAASRRTKDTRIWSPSTIATPSDYSVSQSSSAVTPTNTTRHSNLSMGTSFNRSTSSGSRQILSSFLSRQGSRNTRSPADASLKVPWRGAPRASFASGRTFGVREELAPVVEGSTERWNARLSTGSRRLSTSSAKRLVISRPHSLRPARPGSPAPSRLGLGVATVSSSHRPSSSQRLTVPERVRTPSTPTTPSSIRPSSQYIVPMTSSPPPVSYERAQGSGRLRGPRTPPMSSSSPNLRSAWPTAAEAAEHGRPGHNRRRSSSCPELPPLDLGKVPCDLVNK